MPIPDEVLQRGAIVLGNMMPDVRFYVIKMTVEYMFREMLGEASARKRDGYSDAVDLYRHLSDKPDGEPLTTEEDAMIRDLVSKVLTHDPSYRPVNAFSDLCE